MDIFYTIAEAGLFQSASVADIPGGVRVTLNSGASSIDIDITAAEIFAKTAEKSFKDCSTYYVCMYGPDDANYTIVNKFAETLYTKQTGHEFVRATGRYVPIQVYVPFGGTSLEGATVRVIAQSPASYKGATLAASKEVDCTAEAFTAFAWQVLPKVSAPASASGTVNVQLTLNGQPLAKPGITIYGKSPDGFRVYSATTNNSGVATFMGDSGDTIEFGFRFFSNMASTVFQ